MHKRMAGFSLAIMMLCSVGMGHASADGDLWIPSQATPVFSEMPFLARWECGPYRCVYRPGPGRHLAPGQPSFGPRGPYYGPRLPYAGPRTPYFGPRPGPAFGPGGRFDGPRRSFGR